MNIITRLNIFKKDYKKMIRRGKDIEKLNQVIKTLSDNKKLESKYNDHLLIGPFKGRRECHIEPDWLLIYRTDKEELILERTGSHSDLFE